VLGAAVLIAWPKAGPDAAPKGLNGVAGAGAGPPNTLPPKGLVDELTPDPNVLVNGVLTEGRVAGAVSKGDFFSPLPIPKVVALLDTCAVEDVDVGPREAANEEAMFPKPNDEALDDAEDIAGATLSSNGFVVLYFFASLSNKCRSRPFYYL
jgi:hypothetical protein